MRTLTSSVQKFPLTCVLANACHCQAFLASATLTGVSWYFVVVFIGISVMTYDAGDLSMCILAISLSFFFFFFLQSVCSDVLPPPLFFIGQLSIFFLSYESLQIFSPSLYHDFLTSRRISLTSFSLALCLSKSEGRCHHHHVTYRVPLTLARNLCFTSQRFLTVSNSHFVTQVYPLPFRFPTTLAHAS